MLVIISDLHLTDGTSGSTIDERAFRIFRHRLCDLAYDASWRADGRYKPLKSLDIILLGDILDPIRSTRWHDEQESSADFIRPWGNLQGQNFADKINSINRAILDFNTGSLDILKTLKNVITIPRATRAGRPKKVGWAYDSPGRVPLDIRLHYMVGNHDWFYHVPGDSYNQIRQDVINAMGLSNSAEPFPHALSESESLQMLCRAHNVFVRHGDIFDTYNYDSNSGRDASTLGDAVVVELVSRFPNEVRRRMGEQLSPVCLNGLNEIDNVRPMWVVPVWLNGHLNHTCDDPDQIRKIKDIWDELVDRFLAIPFVRQQDTLSPIDQVDLLELALKFSKGGTFRFIKPFLRWIGKELGSNMLTYYQDALGEPAFTERTAQFVVHAHTHHYEVVPLDMSQKDGKPFEQLYFNSGTWRPVYELTKAGADEEFIGYHEMTYLAFFKDDERAGQAFEVWSGRLGI